MFPCPCFRSSRTASSCGWLRTTSYFILQSSFSKLVVAVSERFSSIDGRQHWVSETNLDWRNFLDSSWDDESSRIRYESFVRGSFSEPALFSSFNFFLKTRCTFVVCTLGGFRLLLEPLETCTKETTKWNASFVISKCLLEKPEPLESPQSYGGKGWSCFLTPLLVELIGIFAENNVFAFERMQFAASDSIDSSDAAEWHLFSRFSDDKKELTLTCGEKKNFVSKIIRTRFVTGYCFSDRLIWA